jgi:hypothetical protein
MSYESTNYFLSESNIKMLWEVILDDDLVVNKNRQEITEINEIFLKLAQQFYDNEKINFNDLISMNKKFISIMAQVLNKNFPKPNPLVIHKKDIPTPTPTPITAEEIQNSRLNIFETELNKKQTEFSQFMTLPIPEKPDFKDNTNDEPIAELDEIIKRTINERNKDINLIMQTFNKGEVENFIKSAETSVRSEKTQENKAAMENIKLEKNKIKRLTWEDESESETPFQNKEKPIQITERPKLKITDIEIENNNKEPTDTNEKSLIEARISKLEKKVNAIFSMVQKLLEEN